METLDTCGLSPALVVVLFWEEPSCYSPVLEDSLAAVLSLLPPVAAVYAKGAAICA